MTYIQGMCRFSTARTEAIGIGLLVRVVTVMARIGFYQPQIRIWLPTAMARTSPPMKI